MTALFYIAAAVAVVATILVITRTKPVHVLLYLVVSFFAVAVILFLLGAAFVAALEVVIYAGAIIVFFLFVLMLLNLSPDGLAQERRWLTPGVLVGPAVLALVLLIELLYALRLAPPAAPHEIAPSTVGATLFGPYVLGVEIASILLLAGLVGAYHLGRRTVEDVEALEHSEVPSPDLRPRSPTPANLRPGAAAAHREPQTARRVEW